MVVIVDKKKCCGCSACFQKCPKHCIEMIEDEEGFLYPRIDSKQCVDCGLCEHVCPIKEEKEMNEQISEAYAAYAKDNNLRHNSSSGAIFSVLAKEVLNRNGVVFGVAYDDHFATHHIYIDNISQLHLLQGSKYLQSRIEDTYKKAEYFLKQGRVVLYTGTACQIAGLKRYLGKEYSNLFSIDVLCHGVPSPKVWRRYLDELQEKYNSKVQQVFFRNKETGWKNYSINISFENKCEYKSHHRDDIYMKLFLHDICLRPSCHECQFKKFPRVSDLTLGDCWGIEKHMPDMDDDKGTSVIVVHTERGKEMLEYIKADIELKEGDLDTLLPPTADSRKSVFPHINRKSFFERFNKGVTMDKLEKFLIISWTKKIEKKMRRGLRKIKKIRDDV